MQRTGPTRNLQESPDGPVFLSLSVGHHSRTGNVQPRSADVKKIFHAILDAVEESEIVGKLAEKLAKLLVAYARQRLNAE